MHMVKSVKQTLRGGNEIARFNLFITIYKAPQMYQ